MEKWRTSLALVLFFSFYTNAVVSGDIRVAVASNFSGAMQKIAALFEEKTGHKVILAFGSTGKHYAQIKNGAPFEAFFAADAERPIRLENEGVALTESRFTYAIGQVVLWSPQAKLVDETGKVLLATNSFDYIAVANPKFAPYGKAAEEIIKIYEVQDKLQHKMVRGENIAQAFQFVKNGYAALGFVAYSQIKQANGVIPGSFWKPPQSFYTPIKQQAVLLQDNEIARAFLSFMKKEKVRKIIRSYGYRTP